MVNTPTENIAWYRARPQYPNALRQRFRGRAESLPVHLYQRLSAQKHSRARTRSDLPYGIRSNKRKTSEEMEGIENESPNTGIVLRARRACRSRAHLTKSEKLGVLEPYGVNIHVSEIVGDSRRQSETIGDNRRESEIIVGREDSVQNLEHTLHGDGD